MNSKILKKRLILVGIMAFYLMIEVNAMERDPQKVKEVVKRVADWLIRHQKDVGTFRAYKPGKNHHLLSWTNSALYVGLIEWSRITDNPQYLNWLKSIGLLKKWELGARPYHADDHAVGQMYLSLYEFFRDKNMIKPTQERLDWILSNRKTGKISRHYGKGGDFHSRWDWCDSLFMAPPVWARLAKITGDQKYLNFMDEEYHETYDLLWDKEEHLFWRDTRFFTRREANGKKLFWSRGNGWVIGGLALMIPDLPKDWKGRPFYINLFKEMAFKLKSQQRADGTWSMGLLGDIEQYPVIETSGTSFITFALAWGVTEGILERDVYEPCVLKAWGTLTKCVKKDGFLGYVQPIGAAPGRYHPDKDKTEVYGIGAFLAAGSWVYRMVGGNVPKKSF